MQIRIVLAAGLLSCSAFALDKPAELQPLPQPFASKPRHFLFPKLVKPSIALKAIAPSETRETCSIPLTNVTPAIPAPRMPVLRGSIDPNTQFTMKFAAPPAPACKDESFDSKGAPDIRP
jgi:hypothetical protein